MTSCIFCKIINGDIPSEKVYEDDTFIVIQTLTQSVKGHTLIIPKEHSTDIMHMDSSLGTPLLKLIQHVGNAQKKGLGADGFNIAVNTGSKAGQQVFHTHIHILPRYEGDGKTLWTEQEVSSEKRSEYGRRIREHMPERAE